MVKDYEIERELQGIYELLLAKAKAGELTACERMVRERLHKIIVKLPLVDHGKTF